MIKYVKCLKCNMKFSDNEALEFHRCDDKVNVYRWTLRDGFLWDKDHDYLGIEILIEDKDGIWWVMPKDCFREIK